MHVYTVYSYTNMKTCLYSITRYKIKKDFIYFKLCLKFQFTNKSFIFKSLFSYILWIAIIFLHKSQSGSGIIYLSNLHCKHLFVLTQSPYKILKSSTDTKFKANKNPILTAYIKLYTYPCILSASSVYELNLFLIKPFPVVKQSKVTWKYFTDNNYYNL